jgi:hypothetical protein
MRFLDPDPVPTGQVILDPDPTREIITILMGKMFGIRAYPDPKHCFQEPPATDVHQSTEASDALRRSLPYSQEMTSPC